MDLITTKLELEPEIEQRLLTYIRAGGYAWVAAESAGIGAPTFYRWMQQGKLDEDEGLRVLFEIFERRCAKPMPIRASRQRWKCGR